MKLLLVEDDMVDRMSIRRILSKANLEIEVTEAISGGDAVEAVAKNDFNLVLLDYNLPDMSGIEVLQKLRANINVNAAVIILTGQENEELAQKCLELGAQDFLLKNDLNPTHLQRAITHSKLRHANEKQLDTTRREMQILAEHDQLTGLLNRYALERRIEASNHKGQKGTEFLRLMLLDLDNFKRINDTYGHDYGDEILVAVANRFRNVCRDVDYLSRLGGDEFAIVMVCSELTEPTDTVNRIFNSLAEPINITGLSIKLECSIGVADFVEPDDKLSDILKKADLAMYQAKLEGKNCFHYFSEALQDAAKRRTSVEIELRRAIAEEEFIVYYQPQFEPVTNKLTGAEALVRWNHPTKGILGPNEFLDVAEVTGLIVDIDQIVMAEACKQKLIWRQLIEESDDFKVAINISARHLKSELFIQNIKELLKDYGIDSNFIELEIVESELVEDFEQAKQVLYELKEMGIDVAIDDFGTGYSSLSYLKKLNVQTLKVDRSFLSDVPKSEVDCRLLKGMINLGQSMELKIVIEGVETKEQYDKCTEYSAEFIQGYHYSKPLDAFEFMEFYKKHQRAQRGL